MKKFIYLIALASLSLTAWSQPSLKLSTYNGTSVNNFDGQQCIVTVDRYIVNGWNTLSLPFAMTEDQIDDALGQGVKLERLVDVSQRGNDITLYFQDCKREGIQANKPYILYYPGETGNKTLRLNADVKSGESKVTLTTEAGVEVTMNGASLKTNGRGLYGILIVNNSDANFTRIDGDNVFYATRCYISTPSDQPYNFTACHLAPGEVTSITDIAAPTDIVDVFNVKGMRVAHGIQAGDINNLEPDIYIVKGRKVLVK